MKRSIALVALAACLACGDKVERHTVEKVDRVCLAEPDTIRAKFATCLSSSCDTLVSAACSIEHEGDEAVLTGRAEIDREGNECTTDCGLVEVICTGSIGEATRVRAGSLVVERDELEACAR